MHTLLLSNRHPARAAGHTQAQLRRGAADADLEQLLVVIAANDQSTRRLLLDAARQQAAVDVRLCSTGHAVVDLVRRRYESPVGCPDVVVLDAPAVGGCQVAPIIEAAYPGIQVVVCSTAGSVASPCRSFAGPHTRDQAAVAVIDAQIQQAVDAVRAW